MGGYERNPAPWALDGDPGGLQRQAARTRTGRGSSRSWPAPSGGCPAIADAGVTRMINGPEGVHAGQRVHPRRVRRPRASSSPPGSAPTASPAPAASAGRSRRGSSTASPSWTCGTWTSGGSGRSTAVARVHARPDDRELLDLLRHPLPQRGAPGRSAAARVAGVRAARGARRRRSARRPAGSGRTGSSRTPTAPARRRRPRSRRSGRAAGRASTGARRSAPRRSRRGRRPALFDETRFAKIEVVGHRRGRVPAAAVRERRRRAGRAASSTPRC